MYHSLLIYNPIAQIEAYRRQEIMEDLGDNFIPPEEPALDLLTQAIGESITMSFEYGRDEPCDPQDDQTEILVREFNYRINIILLIHRIHHRLK